MVRKKGEGKTLFVGGIKKASVKSKKSKSLSLRGPKHAWRLCPMGQHYREGTVVKPFLRRGRPVRGGPRAATCVMNSSGKDQLYPEEIQEMAKRHFGALDVQSLGQIKKFKEKSKLYDSLIVGWTRYWNEILKPTELLDPRIIKALIASESSFNPEAWNKRKGRQRARGLMQVTDESVEFLSDRFPELADHFLNLSADDMLEPNLSICAGVRWLFRKKQLAEALAKRSFTWEESVAPFKSAKPGDKLMKKFDEFYQELRGGK